MKILLADDDRVVSMLYSSLLRMRGYEVVPAFDAAQALALAAQAPRPDLILLDVNMPGGTGMEALRTLKADSGTAAIPVVVVSGTTDGSLPGRARELGASDFLLKPVQPDDLFTTVERVLAGG